MPLTQIASPARCRVIVIGAGFAGVGIGVQLRRKKIDDFLILERAQGIGGVWRDNTYPGAACDIPSHVYSFSFEPKHDWSHVFARQDEIHAYLQHCARKYDLLRHMVFGAEVSHARFDEARSLWCLTLSDGRLFEASLLVSATGQLSRPSLPSIPGLDSFQGAAFHSGRWNHAFDLLGKRVAVIGTGASAIQFVPEIAAVVGSLTLFQRSPPYIVPRPDRPYRAWEKAAFRHVPLIMKLHRAAHYFQYEVRALAFTRLKALMTVAVGLPFQRMLKSQVPQAALRKTLTPSYPIGCKRILLSSNYYSALTRPNVELVTTGIRRITPVGIETSDGRHHAADAIIFGTGFSATDFLAPMQIVGRNGLELRKAWREGAQAYFGLAVPDFPNLFILYGPNTGLGHNSIVYMLEVQIAHVIANLQTMQRKGAQQIEVERNVYAVANARVQQRLAKTVWNGCSSWYVDAKGRNTINWPGFTLTYRWLVQRPRRGSYRFLASAPRTTSSMSPSKA